MSTLFDCYNANCSVFTYYIHYLIYLVILYHVFLSLLLGVWDKVLGPVSEKRNEVGTLKLFPVYLKGEDLFGLTVPAVTKISESVCWRS